MRAAELAGAAGSELLPEDVESTEASRLAEDAAERMQAVAAALAADSGLRKALLQVSQPPMHAPLSQAARTAGLFFG